MKKLHIVSIASEVAPFSKTGGLADVTRSLPKSLKRLSHDVTVITPLYRKITDPKELGLVEVIPSLVLPIDSKTPLTISVWKGELMRGLPAYFIAYDKHFSRGSKLYGYENDNQRFFLFDIAALTLIEHLKLVPDIIHCHDWHTGLIPELIVKHPHFKTVQALLNAATVFTIHNLSFQFGHDWWQVEGLERDRGITPLPGYDDSSLERTNFTKRAILFATVVNAVSETYATEILERNFGQDLHRILQHRKDKLFGIVNGIDYRDFNPQSDPGLSAQFSHASVGRKLDNKQTLQKTYDLDRRDDACVIVMTSRIAEQKGFDILIPIIPTLMDFNVHLIIMGDGESAYVKDLMKLAKQYPNRMIVTPFDQRIETLLYAGGDIALFPSRFEPCGVNQLKSMRYGCIPVARKIGGLSDTVIDVDVDKGIGNGFVFNHYGSHALLASLARAFAHFQHSRSWRELVVRVMQQSNSWEIPARRYIDLFYNAQKRIHE